MITERDRKRAK
jgi:hypothetical protein